MSKKRDIKLLNMLAKGFYDCSYLSLVSDAKLDESDYSTDAVNTIDQLYKSIDKIVDDKCYKSVEEYRSKIMNENCDRISGTYDFDGIAAAVVGEEILL